jgi:hypothetical protein
MGRLETRGVAIAWKWIRCRQGAGKAMSDIRKVGVARCRSVEWTIEAFLGCRRRAKAGMLCSRIWSSADGKGAAT